MQRSDGESMTEKARHAANTIKEKAVAAGKKTVRTIDENRASAASAVDSAAMSLHEKAERLPGGPKVARLAHRTADKLEGMASYVRAHDTHSMAWDAKEFVKEHPAGSLIAALSLGFVVGRMFRRQ